LKFTKWLDKQLSKIEDGAFKLRLDEFRKIIKNALDFGNHLLYIRVVSTLFGRVLTTFAYYKGGVFQWPKNNLKQNQSGFWI
jgi:hypothetical protein